MTKKYKVTYESSVDFLQWEVIVEASGFVEASDKGAESGKVICVELLQELD